MLPLCWRSNAREYSTVRQMHFALSCLYPSGVSRSIVGAPDDPETISHAEGDVMAEARAVMSEISPKLAELSANVLFGDVWERPGLSKRDRSLITVASLSALY